MSERAGCSIRRRHLTSLGTRNKGFFRLEIPLPLAVAIRLFEVVLAKLRARLSNKSKREECLSFQNDSCLSYCQVVFSREGLRNSSFYGEDFI